jgi:AcrR family transcriptional regulator
MGRSAHFDSEHFVSAAQRVMAAEGPPGLTIQKIAGQAGATTGSVYHRFASIDVIAATAWVEAATEYQRSFARSLQGRALFDVVLAGALHTPEWSRGNLIRARVLLRFDAGNFDSADLPGPLRGQVQRLRKDLRKAVAALLRRFTPADRERSAHLLQFLLAEMPLAAVKPHLIKNQRPPAYVDSFIRQSIEGFREELA